MNASIPLTNPLHQNDQYAKYIDHPSGFLALARKNKRFVLPNCPGFISYREQGKHIICYGGIHTSSEHMDELFDGFIRFAESRRLRVLVVQARASQISFLRARGFTVNQLGSSYGLEIANYSFAGSRKIKLRNKIRRARNAGLQVVEIGQELPRTPAVFEKLHQLSNAWIAKKKKKELDFMIGEIGVPEELRRRIFLVQDDVGEGLGFISYVPAWCNKPGYLHDLTRRHPMAPPGTMELCNAFAMERLKGEGVPYLHFGFTPFMVDASEPQGGNLLFAWVVRKLRLYGEAIYPAESQAQYKLKWGIDFIEREYIAGRPLTFRAVLDLLFLTRSL